MSFKEIPKFDTVFYNLKPDIATGALKYYLRTELTTAEQQDNMKIFMNAFIRENKLGNLLERMVKTEIMECSTTPTSIFRRNSMQCKFIKYYTELELKGLIDTVITPVVNKVIRERIIITVCCFDSICAIQYLLILTLH